MGKLFVRLWIIVILTMLASYHVQVAMYENWAVNSHPIKGGDERARRMFVLIEATLEKIPEADWAKQIETLKNKIGSPEITLGIERLVSLRSIVDEQRIISDDIEKLKAGQYVSRRFDNGNGFEVFQRILQSEYVVVLSGPTAQRWPIRTFGLFKPNHVDWAVESGLFAIAIFVWVRLFRRDMLKLDAAAAEIGNGNFNVHVDIKPSAALHPLAASLNTMMRKISLLLASHKQLTNSVSHELRTPIMKIRFRHLLALEEPTIAGKNRELIAMESAIDQLDELSTELLEYAKLDRGDPNFVPSIIDVQPWLDELVNDAQDLTDAKRRSIRFTTETNVTHIEGDYRFLTRAASNLIRNAVRYTKSQVVINVVKKDGRYVLTVDDDGEGIPLSERERLFEPFTRLDRSRDRATGGFGIGLAIVKQVAQLHRGEATIGDAIIGGARFNLSWPIESNATE